MTIRRTPKKRDNKTPYPDRQSARDRIEQLEDDRLASPGELNAYRCPHGSHWHVGHAGKVGAR